VAAAKRTHGAVRGRPGSTRISDPSAAPQPGPSTPAPSWLAGRVSRGMRIPSVSLRGRGSKGGGTGLEVMQLVGHVVNDMSEDNFKKLMALMFEGDDASKRPQ
jgi:hypothetical protein